MMDFEWRARAGAFIHSLMQKVSIVVSGWAALGRNSRPGGGEAGRAKILRQHGWPEGSGFGYEDQQGGGGSRRRSWRGCFVTDGPVLCPLTVALKGRSAPTPGLMERLTG